MVMKEGRGFAAALDLRPLTDSRSEKRELVGATDYQCSSCSSRPGSYQKAQYTNPIDNSLTFSMPEGIFRMIVTIAKILSKILRNFVGIFYCQYRTKSSAGGQSAAFDEFDGLFMAFNITILA
jgi:hypothetical protein